MLRTALTLAAVATLGAAAVPQIAAAQSFIAEGPRLAAPQPDDGFPVAGDHVGIALRRDAAAAGRAEVRSHPPRVVFDERVPRGWPDREGYGDDGRIAYRPVLRAARAYAPYPARAGMPVDGLRPRSVYAASAAYGVDPMPVGPVPIDYGYGTIPEAGCTIEQSQGITPSGWRKIVTHRTCYRR